MATFQRTWTISANNIVNPTTDAAGDGQDFFRQVFLDFKDAVKSAGWTTVASSDGSFVNTSGADLIATPSDVSIGRVGFAEAKSWIVLEAPSNFVQVPDGRPAYIFISTDDSPSGTFPANTAVGIYDIGFEPDLASGTVNAVPDQVDGTAPLRTGRQLISNTSAEVAQDRNIIVWTATDGSFAWASRNVPDDTIFQDLFLFLGDDSAPFRAFGISVEDKPQVTSAFGVTWDRDGSPQNIRGIYGGRGDSWSTSTNPSGLGQNGETIAFPISYELTSGLSEDVRFSTDFYVASTPTDATVLGQFQSGDTDPQRLVRLGEFWAPMNASDFPLT